MKGEGGVGINPTPGQLREGEKMKDREEGREGRRRRQKKDSLSAVFCQGRNYTFTEVFSGNDRFHRSNHWIYEPIFNMKYRHRESILSMFTCLLSLLLSLSQSKGQQCVDGLAAETSASLIGAVNKNQIDYSDWK